MTCVPSSAHSGMSQSTFAATRGETTLGCSGLGFSNHLRHPRPAAATLQHATTTSSREDQGRSLADAGQHMLVQQQSQAQPGSVGQHEGRPGNRRPPANDSGTQQPGRTTAALLASRAAKAQEARALTRSITDCTSWRQLAELWEQNKGRMNHIHQTALVMHLARLATSATATGSSGSGYTAPAAVRAGHITLSKRDLPRLKAFLASLVPFLGMHLISYGPRQLAGVMWALGRLGYQPGPRWASEWAACVSRKLHLLEPRDIAMCAWGAAASNAASTSSPASGGVHGLLLQLAAQLFQLYVSNTAQLPQAQTHVPSKVHPSQGQVSKAPYPQDVANMWWALAAAGVQADKEVLKGLEAALMQCMGAGGPGSDSTHIHSSNGSSIHGRPNIPTNDTAHNSSGSSSTASYTNSRVHPIPKEELGQVMWAMVKLRHCPSERCVQLMVDSYLADPPQQISSLSRSHAPARAVTHVPIAAPVSGTAGNILVDSYLADPSQQPASRHFTQRVHIPAAAAVRGTVGNPEPPTSSGEHSTVQASQGSGQSCSLDAGAHLLGADMSSSGAIGSSGRQASSLPPQQHGGEPRQAVTSTQWQPGDPHTPAAATSSQHPNAGASLQQHGALPTPSASVQQQQYQHRRKANPQSAAHMLWGLARLHHRPPDHLIAGLVDGVVGHVPGATSDSALLHNSTITGTTYSSSTPASLISSTAAPKQPPPPHLSASDAAQAVWSCAALQYRPNPVQLVLLTQAVHQALESTAVQGGTEEEPCMIDEWPEGGAPDGRQQKPMEGISSADGGGGGGGHHPRPPPPVLGPHSSSHSSSHPSSAGHTSGHSNSHTSGHTSHTLPVPGHTSFGLTVSELAAIMWALPRLGISRLSPEQRCAFERAVTALAPVMEVTTPSSSFSSSHPSMASSSSSSSFSSLSSSSFSAAAAAAAAAAPSSLPASPAATATQRLPPSAVSDLVLGAALIKARLPEAALQQLLDAAEGSMHTFQLRHLARLLAGLAVMRCQPPRSFMMAVSDHMHLYLLSQLPQAQRRRGAANLQGSESHMSSGSHFPSGSHIPSESYIPSPLHPMQLQKAVLRRLQRRQAQMLPGSHAAAAAANAAGAWHSGLTKQSGRSDGDEQLVLLPNGRVAKKQRKQQQQHHHQQQQQQQEVDPMASGGVSPEGDSNLLIPTAQASTGTGAPRLLSTLQHSALPMPAISAMDPMQPDDLVMLAWALAKLKQEPVGRRWGAVFAAHAEMAMPRLKPKAAARLQYAMKRLHII